ncbi:hypothetical protein [Lichenicola sp.]|uniref:hypothetical protein n=1 Tax=Lichenicola sp. TaxID=2804529 RepID=UPI003AFFDA0A
MPGIASVTASDATASHSQERVAARSKRDARAIALARQAMNQAQGRGDPDRRAHRPGCVALHQKGVDKASAELTQVQAAENAAAAGSQAAAIAG